MFLPNRNNGDMSFEGYDAPTWRPGPAAVAMDALRSACVRQPILVAQKKIRLSLWCYYSIAVTLLSGRERRKDRGIDSRINQFANLLMIMRAYQFLHISTLTHGSKDRAQTRLKQEATAFRLCGTFSTSLRDSVFTWRSNSEESTNIHLQHILHFQREWS